MKFRGGIYFSIAVLCLNVQSQAQMHYDCVNPTLRQLVTSAIYWYSQNNNPPGLAQLVHDQVTQLYGGGWVVDAVPLFSGVEVAFWGSSVTLDANNYCNVRVTRQWYVQVVRVQL